MKTATEILSDLISIRTDSTKQTNDEIVCYITSILKENDILFELVPVGNLNNIVAGINIPSLKSVDKGIVLSGHMDTVDAVIENWQTNPFQATIKDGKIFGRGAMDMKHFIAVALSLLPKLKELSIPVFLAFSCDEETDVLGVQKIINFFSKNDIHPQYALVGEATDFKLAVGNRGYAGYKTSVQGVAGHAGSPQLGTNAIYIASKIISKIEELNQKYFKQGATLNVGQVKGGVGRNSVPATASFDWEVRFKKDSDKIEVLQELDGFCQKLKADYPKANILNEPKETLLAFEEKEESFITKVADGILKTEKIYCPYASEAGFFQAFGIDTLMCGAGDFKLAHTSNEYVLVSDVEQYRMFLLTLLNQMNDVSSKS